MASGTPALCLRLNRDPRVTLGRFAKLSWGLKHLSESRESQLCPKTGPPKCESPEADPPGGTLRAAGGHVNNFANSANMSGSALSNMERIGGHLGPGTNPPV